MINIKSTSKKFDSIDNYLMTISPAITSLKDVPDGTRIHVVGYMIFDDVKENTGETVEVLSIITDEQEVYSCQSATFKRSFLDIAQLMGNSEFQIEKVSGVTKAGRPYINCILDVKAMRS